MRFFRMPSYLRRLCPSILWQQDTGDRQIFLTFDDGPQGEATRQILRLLEKRQVLATFFVLGERVVSQAALLTAMQVAGHSIGLHGWRHRRMVFCSTSTLVAELQRCRATIESTIHAPAKFFRPPHGIITPSVLRACRQVRLQPVLWSFMSYDFDLRLSDECILSRLLAGLNPGEIVVLHDGQRHSPRTVRLLPKLIDVVRGQGFDFGTLK